MILIKDIRDYMDLMDRYAGIRSPSDFGVPVKYPCYASVYVSDWSNQEESAVFSYQDDIEKMLNDLKETDGK